MPVTGRVRGLATEVAVGPADGVDQPSVVSCDSTTPIGAHLLGRHIGGLLPSQEADLTAAIPTAFDLA